MNPITVTLRRIGALALASGLTLVATGAHADSWQKSRPSRGTPSHWTADGNLVDVQVQVDGATAPLFFRPGANDRHYFQAFEGRNYSILLKNNTGQRVGVVMSVDGLNVLDGQRTDLDRTDPMYVLDPYEQATIRGWRSSSQEVRRFVFVDEDRSYAERTGQANGDLGWIRVASFREVAPRVWWNGQRQRHDDQGYDQAPSPVPYGQSEGAAPMAPEKSKALDKRMMSQYQGEGQDSSPGTGWGDRRYDPVERTHFVAEQWASDRITLRYEYASGLRALGIIPRESRVWERERGQYGFAPPPRW